MGSAKGIQKRTYKGHNQWRYRVYYFDSSTGKRKQKNSKWFNSQSECIEERNRFQLGMISTDKISFKDLSDNYLKSLEIKGDSPRYVANRKRTLELHCDYLNKFEAAKITPKVCQELKNIIDHDKTLHNTRYKNKILSLCSSIFDYGMIHYDLKENPFNKIESFGKSDNEKIHEHELNVLSLEEFEHLYKCCNDYHKGKHELKAKAFYLMFYTGLRKNECLSLTFNDFKGKYLYVNRQYDEKNKTFVSLKSKSSKRNVYLNDDCIKIINDLKTLYSNHPKYTDDFFIFGGAKPISNTSIQKFKQYIIKTYNLKPFNIHDLRHSHATYLISKGIPLYDISKRLGHENVNITANTYIHFIKDEEKNIIDLLNNTKSDK